MRIRGHRRRPSAARRTRASSPAAATTPTTSTARASCMPSSVARTGRTRSISRIDTAAAAPAPGVVAVFTGADMAADKVGGLPCGWQINSKDGSPMVEPPHPVLAMDKVRHVGDPVAVVIAETKQAGQGRGRADRRSTTRTCRPVAIAAGRDRSQARRMVHDEAPGNLCFDWHIGDKAAVDAAFAKAAKVVKLELINNRLIPNAMEPRAAIGDFDPHSGDYTLYTTSQNPHVIRLLMGAFVLHIPEHKLRVVAPDVGGGFGSKIFHYAEEAIVTWAAGKVRRPVKWTAERTESFMSDAHGRDHVQRRRAGARRGRQFPRRCACRTLANMGAYLSTFAPCIPTYLYATLLAGVYTTPAIYCEVKAVFTNTVPVDAYRGAGRPGGDVPARAPGRRVRARHRAWTASSSGARTSSRPTPSRTRRRSRCSTTAATTRRRSTRRSKAADYAGFEARRAEREGARQAARHRHLHLHRGLRHRAVGGGRARSARAPGSTRSANVRVHPTGRVTVFTGSHSHGQGHETTLRAARRRRSSACRSTQVEIVHGDTGEDPVRHGHLRQPQPRGRRLGDGQGDGQDHRQGQEDRRPSAGSLGRRHRVQGRQVHASPAPTSRRRSATSRCAAYVPHNYPIEELEPGLDETAFYDPKNFTFPGGCHVAEVEIDPDTGVVEVVNFIAVDDVGRVINPMIVEGQVHGGVAQGIGQALLENARLRRERPAADRLVSWTTPCRAPTTCRSSRSAPRSRSARTTRWA